MDGDGVMGICALARLAEGTLRNRILVTTVMSNGGLDRAIGAAGGRVIRTPVGDRHVFEAMERADASLGGEQSGHIIFRDLAVTGDGIVAAITFAVSCLPSSIFARVRTSFSGVFSASSNAAMGWPSIFSGLSSGRPS